MRFTFSEVGKEKLSEAERLLAGIPGGAERAVKSAMTRATAHLRTNAGREIRKRYAISVSALRAEENIKITYSYGSGVQAEVYFSGQKIPLFRYDGSSPSAPTFDKQRTANAIFNGNWRKVHPGVAAAGHQFVSTAPTKFANAFVVHFASGHTGIFERTGGVTSNGRDEIEEIMGSAVPQMLGNEEVAHQLAEGAMQKFEERLDHEILRILNGYGG